MARTIGFIGAGNMAGAIIEGILNQKETEACNLVVCDRDPEKTARFASRGMHIAGNIPALAEKSDILFLAVKPQDYETVLGSLQGCVRPDQILVTIAAGISIGHIRARVGEQAKVVRAMPNTPLLLGEGATALCTLPPVTDEEFAAVRRIFEAGGLVSVLPEDRMNAVISVNSTSPAYVYLLAKAVTDGAQKQGIDFETARALFCKTLIGSARMLMESGRTPDELVRMVASPGGTTIAALQGLEEHDFAGAVVDAMLRCTKRADELGR